jgi:hypothetical protein
MSQSSTSDSPASLVAIARAARLCGDRELERAAKRELKERFGIELTFTRQQTHEVKR